MKVDSSTIDKQLRSAGFWVNLISYPSITLFKLARYFSAKSIGKNIDGLDCTERWIPRKSENSTIRIKIYKPVDAASDLPVLLYCHGGGYAITVPEMSHAQIEQFSKERACVIVAPDYRKSLEKPYPAALNDCYDTLLWIKDNATELGAKTDQIMIGGHSAGGGLTAALTLLARDRKEVNISFQMPIYPMIDDRMTSTSAFNNTAPIWNGKMNTLGWKLYLKGLHARNEPIPIYAAPSRATDYSNLPPTATYVGDLEPFRDETIDYVEHLKKEGIPVNFKLFEGCYHGFDAIVPNADVSKAATRFILDAFGYAIDNYTASQKS
ncbi:MAG: alpha/beta hydrolase [Halioglobus sp.]|nr:alpha/beta hydrolase [Halioglobus sp.]